MKKELIISLLFLLLSLILPVGALLPLFGLTMIVVHPTALLIIYAVTAVVLTLADRRIQSENSRPCSHAFFCRRPPQSAGFS